MTDLGRARLESERVRKVQEPMRSVGHRLQLTLLLAAVFVPCAVLVILSMQVMHQDRELRAGRSLAERKQLLDQVAGKLRTALSRIQTDEIRSDLESGQTYRHSETVFVAWVEQGQLVLPWEPERDRAVRRFQELDSDRDFQAAIRACDPSVSYGKQPGADCYRQVEASALHPAQRAYLQWLHAGALEIAGQRSRAAAVAEPLLDAAADVTDPDGIPLKLHASRLMLQAGSHSPRILAALESVLSTGPWHSPLVLLMLAESTQAAARQARAPETRLAAEALRKNVAAKTKLLEQAQLLQTEFPRLEAATRISWTPFGEDLWLVGSAGESQPAVIVVRAQEVLQSVRIPGAVRLADPQEPAGEFIGDSFPGLKLILASPGVSREGETPGLEKNLFSLVLLLTVMVAILAAYLFWRDLQREMRVSELQAQFVSSVSHELKTPLTAIRMFAETLQLGRCTDPAVQTEYLGTIVNECERLSRLVEGVLLFSKAEQGKKIYRFRSIALAEAVYAAVRAMEYPFSQHGFQLHLTILDEERQVQADRDAIEQALLNLLSNAMKFSGDARDIELSLVWETDEAIIRVTDHGIGIAPEEQSRIFEKFYRVSTSQNQLIPGAGLGLALVAQIAQAHGGRVTVESALSKGSTFCLRLPAPSGAAPGAACGKEQLT